MGNWILRRVGRVFSVGWEEGDGDGVGVVMELDMGVYGVKGWE